MKKILIANRGEIACRVIRTCCKLGLRTVAVYSEADQGALHVALADEAVAIGPAAARDSYLRADRILTAAKASGADAVHPGYGFLSENAAFAREVLAGGLGWIGPSPDTIRDMGDKQRARDLAERSGVPVLPGSRRFADGDFAGLEAVAHAIGYPLLVKAAAGGGGIGMRRVDAPGKLLEMAIATQSMATKAFGDGAVYLERYVPKARHVEIQVFGFGDGRAVHLYERDCSLQRRFQKVIEESPAPGLPESVRHQMASAATRLCEAQRYEGAGTVEFVVDADTFEFYFLEMNTRIQVEHPVTEMTTGLDLVEMQIAQASRTLVPPTQSQIERQGHAIECRLYAENPAKNFMPSPGVLKRFDFPENAGGVRIDTGFRAGDEVSFHYDPMIAKVICHGETRTAAIDRCVAALESIRIEGLVTNLGFLRSTVQHPAFQDGNVFTGFIDAFKATLTSSGMPMQDLERTSSSESKPLT